MLVVGIVEKWYLLGSGVRGIGCFEYLGYVWGGDFILSVVDSVILMDILYIVWVVLWGIFFVGEKLEVWKIIWEVIVII